MRMRKDPTREQFLDINWRVVPWEEMPPTQRANWAWLWSRLLDPAQSDPETRLPHDSGSSHGAAAACETAREDRPPQPGGEESRHG